MLREVGTLEHREGVHLPWVGGGGGEVEASVCD